MTKTRCDCNQNSNENDVYLSTSYENCEDIFMFEHGICTLCYPASQGAYIVCPDGYQEIWPGYTLEDEDGVNFSNSPLFAPVECLNCAVRCMRESQIDTSDFYGRDRLCRAVNCPNCL
ncbi:MAG: hypothetical protein Harvfovirus3_41 [Harvfovirus sp.]|uniref:Uncharacterized protein n=1 Tax=Harvfovirus sp. TaxID=2487768 RepID=A0A3G5A039_9VIRU|nr:MAG: hypothetical protein Harvfovirus3_41 [Harvfovirus sp.]